MRKPMFVDADAVWIVSALTDAVTLHVLLDSIPNEGDDPSEWVAVARELKLAADNAKRDAARSPQAKRAAMCLRRLSDISRTE